jgi:hypothetical protein
MFFRLKLLLINGLGILVLAVFLNRCQFHQHFTCAFFVQKSFRQLSLITVRLRDFLSKGYRRKMLMKLTPCGSRPTFESSWVLTFWSSEPAFSLYIAINGSQNCVLLCVAKLPNVEKHCFLNYLV